MHHKPTEPPSNRISPMLEHFINCAYRGRSTGASGGEKKCRKVAEAMLENLIGVDDTALQGCREFASMVSGNYETLKRLLG